MVTALIWENTPDYEVGNIDQDGLWKKVIGELFEDFLLFFSPELHAQIDFTKKPDFLQQELFQKLIKEKRGRQAADQIVKIHLKDGAEKWVLLHVEIQSDNEQDFAERMFQYFYRIYDQYGKKIVAIAVMTSPHKSELSTEFHYSYFGTKLDYTYTTYKVANHDYEELEQSDKIFSKIVLATKYMNATRKDADKRYTFKMKLMREIIKSKRYSRTEIRAVFYFIDYLLRLPEELSAKLYEKMIPIMQKEANGMVQFDNEEWSPTMDAIFTRIREDGEKKGIEQGMEAAITKVALEMLKEGSSIEFISKVTNLDKKAIEKLQKMN